MSRKIAALMMMGVVLGAASRAFAQQENNAPGLVEVTYMPAGVGYIASKNDSPSFGNYGFGTAVTFNITRMIGIEGELTALIATTSDLQFGDLNNHTKAPNMLGYNGNVVFSPWRKSSFAPYAAGGVGGLTMFERPQVGVPNDETFLTGNVGGGVKWYAPNNRWGLRGDYRFVAAKSKDDAPEFFGQDTRYIHRVYAGVVINTVQ
jgi:Outer membrane protein beta-barrel domain